MKSAMLLALFASCVAVLAAQDDKIGKYDPPPKGLKRVKVGIPRFKIEKVALSTPDAVSTDGRDCLLTLVDRANRFNVIEFVLFEQLLKEQGLDDVKDPEELAKPGKVKGVDYLFVGKVTNLSVRGEDVGPGSKWDARSKVTAECGVDIRLMDTKTGECLAAEFGEWKNTDIAEKLGVAITGEVKGSTKNELDIDEDSRGLILRQSLHRALRKMLPKVDKRLLERQK